MCVCVLIDFIKVKGHEWLLSYAHDWVGGHMGRNLIPWYLDAYCINFGCKSGPERDGSANIVSILALFLYNRRKWRHICSFIVVPTISLKMIFSLYSVPGPCDKHQVFILRQPEIRVYHLYVKQLFNSQQGSRSINNNHLCSDALLRQNFFSFVFLPQGGQRSQSLTAWALVGLVMNQYLGSLHFKGNSLGHREQKSLSTVPVCRLGRQHSSWSCSQKHNREQFGRENEISGLTFCCKLGVNLAQTVCWLAG